jgi:hypothetical protein
LLDFNQRIPRLGLRNSFKEPNKTNLIENKYDKH